MQAYALLSPEIRRDYQLVLASRLSKSHHDDSRAKMNACRENAGLAEDELVLTDFMPDDDLVALYNMANLFVFPSKHEGFGLPPLEAMACGTPVAAYPVTGPIDVLGNSPAGAMNEDLREACMQALKIPREVARAHAEKFSWRAASEQFVQHLKPVPSTEVHVTALA